MCKLCPHYQMHIGPGMTPFDLLALATKSKCNLRNKEVACDNTCDKNPMSNIEMELLLSMKVMEMRGMGIDSLEKTQQYIEELRKKHLLKKKINK